MAFIRKMSALGTAVAMAAVLFGAFGASASAQVNLPYTAYGIGQEPGATVAWTLDGTECGSTTVDADGNWLLSIGPNDTCDPSDGNEIGLTLDGVAAGTITFAAGGAPASVEEGIALEPVADAGDGDAAPEPAETGNAGLLGSTGTSMALVLALGVFAAAMVAGGRTATRRS